MDTIQRSVEVPREDPIQDGHGTEISEAVATMIIRHRGSFYPLLPYIETSGTMFGLSMAKKFTCFLVIFPTF